MDETQTDAQRELLLAQAGMIYEAGRESVPEAVDREDIRREYEEVLAAAARRRQDRADVLDLPTSQSAP